MGESQFGYVFNIQHYSVHDGPGIRTIVFLKGCPLRCKWCCNPESQKLEPELGYNANKCIGSDNCLRCAEVCAVGAIKQGNDKDKKILIDRDTCTKCMACADACPAKALEVFGKKYSVDEIIKTVEKDSLFYGRSGGGLTISGGEPLVQAYFTLAILKQARSHRINTAIETCGYGDWTKLAQVCEHLNTLIMDIKCMDPEKHKEFTGVSNELILSNFKKLCQEFPNLPKLIRTPVIPGFNDTEEDIQAIVDFIKGQPNVQYELLKYHRLGEQKYTYIGKTYPYKGAELDDEKFKRLKEIAKPVHK